MTDDRHAAADVPQELVIDTDVVRRTIGDFIRTQLEQAGFERAVVGLSGGIDSALVAFLVAEAIGPDRLLCVSMPDRNSSPDSRSDAAQVVRQLGCHQALVEIAEIVESYIGGPDRPRRAPAAETAQAEALRRGNFAARIRMSVLYDHSAAWRGLVVGTGNKTESLIGYTTMYGDNACAFNPIGDLYKTQVRQLAAVMGVPVSIQHKPPSADLWPGQTDESEMGISYASLDRLLVSLVDRGRSHTELEALGFDRAQVERVSRMIAGAAFKRQMPPIARLDGPEPSRDR